MTLRRAIGPLSTFALVACAEAPPMPPEMPEPPPKCADAPRPAVPKTAVVKTPEDALVRLFNASKVEAAWFAPAFVAQVPTSRIESILSKVKAELGAFSKIEKEGDKLFAMLEKGRVPIKIALDGEGRISSLWFSPSELTVAPPDEEVSASFESLPGKVSVLVLTDGKEVLARDADAPMAVGSAFKLAILDALRERIEAKKARWSDVVRLDPKNKSLPSGTLHTWPDGAPLTLHTVASLMISESDNTATDVLLGYVGREAVEKRAPGNAPFLSTRDAFVLKAKSNAALLGRWRAADAEARRRMLPELRAAKVSEGDFTGEPSIDVEWTFSARRLCELLSHTKSLDVTRINPGLASTEDWDLVAYKGGSEPGVLNFTSWVEKDGKKHCVVTTWNDPEREVDSSKLSTLHRALLLKVRESK